MTLRLAIVASLVLTIAACRRESYSRSSSGFSSLDKKVLYDFRSEPPAARPLDEATRIKVVSAASRSLVVAPSVRGSPDCRPGTALQIRGSAEGSFTAAGLKQTAYLVDMDECALAPPATTRRLLVFTGSALTADVEVPGANAILGAYDLDGDRKNELLLGRGRFTQGRRSHNADLVEFDKDKLTSLEDFGQVYDDSCDSDQPSKSVAASIVYVLPPPAGQKPRFSVELYRAPCPATGQAPEWKRVSGK